MSDSSAYWEARARILANRNKEPKAPAKRAAKRAEVEQPPAAETPGDPGLTTKE